MSNIVDLVEAGDAVAFQNVINEKLAVKVGAILSECQAYIASRLFEEGDGAGEETPGEDADAPHDADDNNEHV